MSYVRGNAERHCKNCERRLKNNQEYYCSYKCRRENETMIRPLTTAQLNIVTALKENEGVRWLPNSDTLQLMIKQHIPLVKKMNVRSVGIGKSKDYLIRFTVVGLRWVEKNVSSV